MLNLGECSGCNVTSVKFDWVMTMICVIQGYASREICVQKTESSQFIRIFNCVHFRIHSFKNFLCSASPHNRKTKFCSETFYFFCFVLLSFTSLVSLLLELYLSLQSFSLCIFINYLSLSTPLTVSKSCSHSMEISVVQNRFFISKPRKISTYCQPTLT